MGYLEQEPHLDDSKTVWENVIAWCEEKQIVDRYNAIAMELGENYTDELMEEMTALQEKIDAGDLWDIDSKVEMAMDALRCPPNDSGVTKLSGGEKRRVALARLLLSKPDMLLLDEPTNHLDAESVAWLQHHLEAFPGCVILVTHDRYFLNQVTSWTLELDRGKGVPYEGNYSGWLEQKQKRVVQEQSESEARQRALTKELEWVRSNAKARQTKSKARLAAYERMVTEQENARGAQTHAVIQIPPGPRLGNVVLEVEGLEKEYGDKLPVQGPDVQAAAQRHRRRHRPQRRRQVDPVQADHRPGNAGRRHRSPRRDGQAGLCRPEPRRPDAHRRPSGRPSVAAPT
jgi:ATPase subunit of ABC transporter with duplicated ATPase domains